ncbi:MAG: hypothetical protein H7098_13540, partial [Oligoflexus sp.]|nr:hypothetical protein [Pseudopedobacter sp.]
MNTVAFFCDRNMIPGFHAASSSLLINNCSTTPLKIFAFSDGLSQKEKQLIFKTFQKLRKENHSLEIRKAPIMKIPGANSLSGNFTAYGRLFLGELLQESNLVLYLDSDIIINMDINTVFEEMVGD